MNGTQPERTSIDNALFLCLALVAFLSFSNALEASPIVATGCDEDCPPAVGVLVTVTGFNPVTNEGSRFDFPVPVNSDNTFSLDGARANGQGWTLNDLNVSGNIDPFTSLNYAVTNNAAVTLLFTVSVSLPIAPQLPATLHGGSMGGTLTDANFNGVATVATVGGGVPFYQGQIDGSTVLSIYPDPYSLSVAFAGQTINVPALNPGLPGPTLPSGPAFATIGIINRFSLTAGDQFSGNSFFVVVPVPEPSTLALLGLCFMGFAGRRRR